jgi:hypothetical protein
VRIIELFPGHETPACLPHTLALSVAVRFYEAVSYTWGDPRRSTNIVCDGKSLAIPQSSMEVLENLPLPDRSRFLWIDAICINQETVSEINGQVRIMRHIYSYAKRVVIWLGVEHEHTDTALTPVRTIAGLCYARHNISPAYLAKIGDIRRFCDGVGTETLPRPNDSSWDALKMFFQRR